MYPLKILLPHIVGEIEAETSKLQHNHTVNFTVSSKPKLQFHAELRGRVDLQKG